MFSALLLTIYFVARFVTSNLGQNLVIRSVTKSDEGHYTCTATNKLIGKSVKLEAFKGKQFLQ